ncbi:TraB/GumN family protein [Sediminibacterium sp. C3]|uniref:TraB/GumN family protein n=1 Tax=Sediminibacterium sp. C3 TaxID=1267211 RepID=UPI0004236B1F|nr:TraB/GumN family protein [Sediminibacterium sp. C3]
MKWMIGILIGLFSMNAAAQSSGSSLLWEISGNGLARPSYLYGTFHMLCANDYTISEVIKQKLLGTRKLYLEVDITKPGIQQELMMQMKLTETTLDKELGADFQQVDQAFQKITGISLNMFKQFKPFVSTSMLTLQTLDCPDKIQTETILSGIAKNAKIGIEGLETVADQVAAINAQPLDSQLHAFKKMVLEFDFSKKEMRELVRVYQLNHTDSIYAYMKNQSMSNDFEQHMLIRRNRNWIPKMIAAIHDAPAFFAVGAGHLGGQEGVLSLLRDKGYQLKPLAL